MPRASIGNVPDALWDNKRHTALDPRTKTPLPNYEGLVLFTPDCGLVMIMNTWLEDGERRWQHICMGWYVPHSAL